MSSVSRNQFQNQFLSTREAAAIVGYTSDYVARLAREGAVAARRSGSQWLVDIESLKLFSLEVAAEKRNRKEMLRQERLHERIRNKLERRQVEIRSAIRYTGWIALAQTVVVSFCLLLVFNLVWFSLESEIDTERLAAGVTSVKDRIVTRIIEPNRNFFFQSGSMAFVGQTRIIDTSEDLHVVSEPVVSSSSSKPPVSRQMTKVEINTTEPPAVLDNFSDETRVNFADDDSGTVAPVFQNRIGELYRLNLVPVLDEGQSE